jgi:predicted nucleic acid-binding protein
VLDATDPFHAAAMDAFQRAERERWDARATNYVVHEAWALIQHRLGWDAIDDFLDAMLPLCRVEFVDAALHNLGAARCRQARQRHLSFTDCVSLEYMQQHQIREAIARDEHFAHQQIALP